MSHLLFPLIFKFPCTIGENIRILHIQHIKLNQQLTTVTEEIEELKSRKEQLIFQAECSTDKDMTNLSKKYDQMNNNLDILDSQDISLKKQLEKDARKKRQKSSECLN